MEHFAIQSHTFNQLRTGRSKAKCLILKGGNAQWTLGMNKTLQMGNMDRNINRLAQSLWGSL